MGGGGEGGGGGGEGEGWLTEGEGGGRETRGKQQGAMVQQQPRALARHHGDTTLGVWTQRGGGHGIPRPCRRSVLSPVARLEGTSLHVHRSVRGGERKLALC